MPWITFGVIPCEKHKKKRIKDFVDLSTLDTSLKIKDPYTK
jgi:hypothetical protein